MSTTDTADAQAPTEDASTGAAKSTARSRGELEASVKRVTDSFVTGQLVLGEGQALTPHRIARAIQSNEGLDAPPSPGAVAAVLARWQEVGFANLTTSPVGFGDYTEAASVIGLAGLKARFREGKKAAKNGATEAGTPASGANASSTASSGASGATEAPVVTEGGFEQEAPESDQAGAANV